MISLHEFSGFRRPFGGGVWIDAQGNRHWIEAMTNLHIHRAIRLFQPAAHRGELSASRRQALGLLLNERAHRIDVGRWNPY